MARLAAYSRLIALPHSVFALPFAMVALLVSYLRGPVIELVHAPVMYCVLVVLAVLGARTAAMAFNRVLDADIDRGNPRTANREIPRGEISRMNGVILGVIASGTFLLCSFAIGWHCFVLGPVVLAVVIGYSLTKRYTPYAHFVLGLSLALAPGGAWWVFRPQIELTPLLLMGSVLLWVSGFDILYSCQDVLFDREKGIFSIPARLGVYKSLLIARVLHFSCFVGLWLFGMSIGLAPIYYFGLSMLAIPLFVQHRLVSPFDLSKINHAFFTANGFISIGYLLLTTLALEFP